MNEQIEKLAELSGFKQDMLNIGIWYSPEFQKFAERFAELIIKECAGLVQGVPIDTMGYQSADQKIRQHFGVKE